MTSDLQQAKRPVSAVLAGPYGHPLHPVLVTVPIGAWVASLVFDVASHLVADPEFLARGSLWLIGLGVVGRWLQRWSDSWTCWPSLPARRCFAPGWCMRA
jgi:uncharacterized membrane protein